MAMLEQRLRYKIHGTVDVRKAPHVLSLLHIRIEDRSLKTVVCETK